jgi:capsule polysaccharide export protein KpsE/RkpR
MATRNIWRRIGSNLARTIYVPERIDTEIADGNSQSIMGNIHHLVSKNILKRSPRKEFIRALEFDIKEAQSFIIQTRRTLRDLKMRSAAFSRKDETQLLMEVESRLTLINGRLECIKLHLKEELE